MWFLPLLVVGAIAMAFAKRSSQKIAPPTRQLPRGSSPVPGPISVLGEILRVGQAPPPTVILCAIAEAQAIGRNDLASDIVQVFVAPVVRHHQRARGQGRSVPYERGSCAIVHAPRDMAQASPPPAPMSWSAPPPVVPQTNAAMPASSDNVAALAQSAPSPFAASVAPDTMSAMDDEINTLLHSDPAKFMELVSRSGSFPSKAAMQPATQPAGVSPEPLAQMQPAMAPGSPIRGVSDAAWRDFVVRLSRESPQFSSSRHVGQYRQRRERLAELGINPTAIVNSPEAQRTALDADLTDAHRHGMASELFAQHLGRPVTLPGRESTDAITLSGVLGVIQCAGLEGAVGWLESATDRKRYPHTTQAFLNTNGVF